MASKGYGNGSMKEVAPGRWRLRVYIGNDPATGKPLQRGKTFRGTETHARKELASMVTKADEEKVVPTALTVDQMLTEWIRVIEPTRAPTTIAGIRNKVANYVSVPIKATNRPALGSIPLTKLTAHHLDMFYDDLLACGLSTTTVRQHHAILAAALHRAEKWGWIELSPARKASPPTARKVEMKIPTPAELQGYILACDKRMTACSPAPLAWRQ